MTQIKTGKEASIPCPIAQNISTEKAATFSPPPYRLGYNPPDSNFSTPKSTSLRVLESKERPISHTGRVSAR